ncbi:glycosyltransferase family 4 protein [Actinomycetota bacterium]
MKISILTPDLSHNCIGRAYTLAKILQKEHEVEIVGPLFGDAIWKPVADDKSIKYRSIKFNRRFSIQKLRKLYSMIDGDVIYASKPLFTSFGIGLIKKFITGKPLILDIDDWELGFKKDNYLNSTFRGKVKYLLIDSVFQFFNNSSYWNILFLEKLIRFSDRITVSNCFLNKRSGGTLVHHGRDKDLFDPENFSRSSLRKKYKIDKHQKVIMFLGTPHAHKGIGDLVEAVYLNKNNDILLVLVGMSDSEYCMNLIKDSKMKLSGRLRIYGLQSFTKIPEFLSIADIIVVPQKRKYSSIGQTPAKIFDAMAMAKTIIATDTSGMAEILDDCGLIVVPDDPKKLNRAINDILSNPEEAVQMGSRARRRFINEYSFEKIEKILGGVFKGINKN